MNYEKRELLSKLIEELTVEDVKEILSDVYKSLHSPICEEEISTQNISAGEWEDIARELSKMFDLPLAEQGEIFVRDEDPNKKRIEVRIEDLRKIVEKADRWKELGYKLEKVTIVE